MPGSFFSSHSDGDKLLPTVIACGKQCLTDVGIPDESGAKPYSVEEMGTAL